VRYVEMYEAGRKVRVAVSNRVQGYASLEAVRAKGGAQGLREAIVAVLIARGLAFGDDLKTALAGIEDPAILRPVVTRAATAATADEVLADLRG
jgi:hypothetical protein